MIKMKNKFFLLLTFISLCLCYNAALQAQTVDDLQKERKQIQERILNTNKQIKQKTIITQLHIQSRPTRIILNSYINDNEDKKE